MKSHSKLVLYVLVAVTAIVVTVTASLQVRKQSPRPITLQRADEEFYTVVDYSVSTEPTEPKKRAARKVQARRYNMHREEGVDPKQFAITEERESTFGLPPTHSRVEPALPAAQSAAVVIGNVTSAQAFLAEDKTEVISEFSIQIDDVLKENLSAPFSVGDSLDAVRSGGGVRFPSGKTIRYGAEGKPLPKVGRRYLFFLKYNDDTGSDYSIITAYELQNDHVAPLDGISLSGVSIPAYANYQKYKGATTAVFLNEVRDAIARNLGGEPLRRGLAQ